MRTIQTLVAAASVAQLSAVLPWGASRKNISDNELASIDASQWIGGVQSYTCDCDFVNIPLCREWLHIASTMPPMQHLPLVIQHIHYASQLVGGFDCELKPINMEDRDFPARLSQYVMCVLADWAQTRMGWIGQREPASMLFDVQDDGLVSMFNPRPDIVERVQMMQIMYGLRFNNMSYCLHSSPWGRTRLMLKKKIHTQNFKILF